MPKEKPFKPVVFISTTSSDLRTVREGITAAALKLGWHPEVEEYFEADYRTLRESIKRKIDECDFVVHVVGLRYGAEPSDQPPDKRQSYTQMEYEIAQGLGKRTYVFICDKQFRYDPLRESDGDEDAEKSGLQEKHRRMLCSNNRRYNRVSSREELDQKIREIRILVELIRGELEAERLVRKAFQEDVSERLKKFSPTRWFRVVILLALTLMAASVSTPWNADFMRPALVLGAVGVVAFLMSILISRPWLWFAVSVAAYVGSTVSAVIAPFRAQPWTYIAVVPTNLSWQSWQCEVVESPIGTGSISTLVVRDPLRVALASRLAAALHLPAGLLKTSAINGRRYLELPVRHLISGSFLDKDGLTRWHSLYVPIFREGMKMDYGKGWDLSVQTLTGDCVIDATWPESKSVVPWHCVEITSDMAEQAKCILYAAVLNESLEQMAAGDLDAGMQILSSCGEPGSAETRLVAPPDEIETARVAVINACVSGILWRGTVGHVHKIPFLTQAFQNLRLAMSSDDGRAANNAMLNWAFTELAEGFDAFGESFVEEKKASLEWSNRFGLPKRRWVSPTEEDAVRKDIDTVYERFSQKIRATGRPAPLPHQEWPDELNYCRYLDDRWRTQTPDQLLDGLLRTGEENSLHYLPFYLLARFYKEGLSADESTVLSMSTENKRAFQRLETARPDLCSKQGWIWLREAADFAEQIYLVRFHYDKRFDVISQLVWCPPFLREFARDAKKMELEKFIDNHPFDSAAPWWTRGYRNAFAAFTHPEAVYMQTDQGAKSACARVFAALEEGRRNQASFQRLTRDQDGSGTICLPAVILWECVARGRGYGSARDFDELCVDTTRPTAKTAASDDKPKGGHAIEWREVKSETITEDETPNGFEGTISYGPRFSTQGSIHYHAVPSVPIHLEWVETDVSADVLGAIERHAVSVMQKSIDQQARSQIDPDQLAGAGEEDIREQMLRRGYCGVHLVRLAAKADNQSSGPLTYAAKLLSGPRYTISQVKFSGLPKGESSKVPGVVTVKPGDAWNVDAFQKFEVEVHNYFDERGYIDAQVEVDWKAEPGSTGIIVMVKVNPGKPFQIKSIEFVGPPIPNHAFPSIFPLADLRALTSLREGDPCDRNKLQAWLDEMRRFHRLNGRVSCDIGIDVLNVDNPRQKLVRVTISDAE